MSRPIGFAFAVLVSVASLSSFAVANENRVAVRSPNGEVEIVLERMPAEDTLVYSVKHRGTLVVEPSPIDIRLAEVGSLADGASIEGVEKDSIDETDALPWGNSSRIRNHCQRAKVRLKSGAEIEWELELRAYDDGVALRYEFPEQEKLSDFTIEEEATEFRLAGDPSVLYLPLASFTTSHEGLYDRKALSELPADQLFAVPLLAVWPDGNAAAITEARLRDYAGMYLVRHDDADRSVLRSRLSPLPGKSDARVVSKTPHQSPWRVVLLGDQAGQLIESDLVVCLNEPAEGDFDWVEPGKTTFTWWNGTIEHGPPSTPESNFAIHKKYIDFCAEHDITYHSVISVAGNRPWHVQKDPGFSVPHPDSDVLTPRPDIDLPRILEYAEEQGVGIRFWVHWKPLSEHLEEAFAQYEEWGIRGLMVDFMDRDDQEMVELQERMLQVAAKHKLHLQFHGAYKPTGEHRTYPNMFNREGVLNLEFLKWSDKCSPQHNLNVAYTRLLAGPTDYHSGGFRAATREEFKPQDEMPLVLGTRCHHLAMYVVYLNPMPMLCDVPSAYEDEPGFDFLLEVPTTWDETRFVAGEAGEYVVVARRQGDTWYLGGMTNWTERKLSIPLDFLGDGTFEAALYLDGAAALEDTDPNAIRQKQTDVTADAPLEVSLGPGGGVAAVFRPK